MNLVLFGSGEFTPAVDDIDEYLISQYKPQNIAILPTAAGVENDASKWLDMAKQHYAKYNLSVIPVPIYNKVQANEKRLTDQLKQADWIFLSGGNPNYLFETLKDSELWKIILKQVDDGALIAGSSAGAMIMGKFLLSPSLNTFFKSSSSLWQRAFGLVDYTIIPHFDHFKKQKGFMLKILRISPNKIRSSWMGIDENTAIILDDLSRKVIGSGSVEIHDSTGIHTLNDKNT
jgi:cyanophycinase